MLEGRPHCGQERRLAEGTRGQPCQQGPEETGLRERLPCPGAGNLGHFQKETRTWGSTAWPVVVTFSTINYLKGKE